MSRRWIVEVVVMPKTGVNDPEGEAILGGLHDLGYESVSRVRAGRQFRIVLAARDVDEARELAMSMSDRLLANPVIESFEIERLDPVHSPSENGA